MVSYNYEVQVPNLNESSTDSWILSILNSESKELGEINYIFCDDEFLLEINKKFLNHNTYTDIISFDYTVGTVVSGDIYISVDRVKENAERFKVDFSHELHRVMAHGILHYCGYKDKSEADKAAMRSKEDQYLELI